MAKKPTAHARPAAGAPTRERAAVTPDRFARLYRMLQILAGVITALTLYTQEVGIFLLLPLGVQILARLWSTRKQPADWLVPLASAAIARCC